eukprot:107406-Pleurochrysis_carterae.AAC.1
MTRPFAPPCDPLPCALSPPSPIPPACACVDGTSSLPTYRGNWSRTRWSTVTLPPGTAPSDPMDALAYAVSKSRSTAWRKPVDAGNAHSSRGC